MENDYLELPPAPKKRSAKKLLLVALSAILGGVFLFSAWTKTEPSTQYFEYIIGAQVHLPPAIAAIAARFFIGLEAALGLMLIVSVFGYRRWVLKASIALIVVFSIHLIYLLFAQGNDVNCGCMGNVAPMSPLASLAKNAGILAALFILLKWHRTDDGPVLNIASFPVAASIIAIPFFLYPIQKQLTMPLTKLYTTTRSQHPMQELRKGKHILCFMSLTCSHCRDAATIIAKMKKDNPALPFYFALAGGNDSTRAELFHDFLSETKANNVPYHFLSKEDFGDMIKLSGSDGVPVMMWMQDTTVIRKITVNDLNQKEIEEWLR
ncbi:MAG: hypothetical protein EOP49_29805 [Sphingobacteriales bacterium]|nr:MAG: hypothetical protein EOP49_29805 [Sphingobacteriales bacterium]